MSRKGRAASAPQTASEARRRGVATGGAAPQAAQPAFSREQALRSTVAAMEVYQARIESLSGQAQSLENALTELLITTNTLREYAEVKDGDEILIPPGSNTFLYARAASPGKAITHIGAGVSKEEPVASVLDRLKRREETLRATHQKVMEALRQEEANLQDANMQAQRLSRGEAAVPFRGAKPGTSEEE